MRVWASQLAKCGLLLLDEVESISPSDYVLSHHWDIQSSLIIHKGKSLYVVLY